MTGDITGALKEVAVTIADLVERERWRPQMSERTAGSKDDDTYVSTALDDRASEEARRLLEEGVPGGFEWYSEEQGLEGASDRELVIVADAVDGTVFSHPGRPDYGACCLAAFDRDSNCLGCVVADLYSPTVFWYDGTSDLAFIGDRDGAARELHIPQPYPRKSLRHGCFIASVLMRAERLRDFRVPLARLYDHLADAGESEEGLPNSVLGLSFGGSPTIARVAATGLPLQGEDKPGSTPRGVDLCFDLKGGRFHDLAGPAHIAKAAGGVVLDLDKRDMLDPGNKHSYLRLPTNEDEVKVRHRFVIAASRELAEEFLKVIGPKQEWE